MPVIQSLRDSDREWPIPAETWPSSILHSMSSIGPVGWYGKTSPVSCRRMEDGTLVPLSEAWSNSGMASRTECLTLSTSEYHSDTGVCSLSDILETGDVPPKFYLSPRACAGILRRAEKRGKSLPQFLAAALQAVASELTSTVTAA